jgi:hypothetical protein
MKRPICRSLLDKSFTKLSGLSKIVKDYKAQSAKQTSDSARRDDRQRYLTQAIQMLIARRHANGKAEANGSVEPNGKAEQ